MTRSDGPSARCAARAVRRTAVPHMRGRRAAPGGARPATQAALLPGTAPLGAMLLGTVLLSALLLAPGAARAEAPLAPLPAAAGELPSALPASAAPTSAESLAAALNACVPGPERPLDRVEGYKDNALLPWTQDGVTSRDRMADEFKFQFSLRKEVFRCAPLHAYVAYTQTSLWQFYDVPNSRPFRASNYNPELFLELRGDFGAAWPALFRFGVEHESNGLSDPDSRSWSRVYAMPGWGTPGGAGATVKLWWRFPESRKTSPTDTTGDDNPDIEDYLGSFELRGWWTGAAGGRLSGMFRRGTLDGTETVQLDLDWPIGFVGSGVSFRVEGFSGYGETLIDYNRRVSRFGLGVVFH